MTITIILEKHTQSFSSERVKDIVDKIIPELTNEVSGVAILNRRPHVLNPEKIVSYFDLNGNGIAQVRLNYAK